MIFNKLNKRLTELEDRITVLEAEQESLADKLKQTNSKKRGGKTRKLMKYKDYAVGKQDIRRIDKLNALTDPDTFWNDVKKLTKRTHSDRALDRWQALADIRYSQIKEEE